MKIRAALLLLMMGSTTEAIAQFRVLVNEGRPLVLQPGEVREFFIDVHRAAGGVEVSYLTSFRDPTTSGRPTFPFGFSEIRAGRCNADFGADFLPGPNFAGWFGATNIAPGETLRCRVEVGADMSAVHGEYLVEMDGVQFTVVVAIASTKSVPTLGGLGLLLLMLLLGMGSCLRLSKG